MSSVLHPMGPEAPQTYWVRRAVVIAAAIMVLAVVVALIINGTSSGSAAVQPPAPAPTPVVADSASPSPMSTAMRTPTSLTPSESSSASTKASTKPSAKASTKPSAKASSKTSSKPSASPSVTAKPGLAACPADQLRVTLTGKQRLKVKKSNVFQLSVINGSGQTCMASITGTNFELKIYSGTDRIWSTNDCATAVKTIKKKLLAERVAAWSMSWNGRRSLDGCKNRPEIPRAGTYFATAQLDGAKPVQLRMILHG